MDTKTYIKEFIKSNNIIPGMTFEVDAMFLNVKRIPIKKVPKYERDFENGDYEYRGITPKHVSDFFEELKCKVELADYKRNSFMIRYEG